MTGPWPGYAIDAGFALLGGFAVPWVLMRLLVPTLEESALGASNYRGRRVVVGLGVVWVAWAIGMRAAGVLVDLFSLEFWSAWQFPPQILSVAATTVPLVLVLGAVAVGMVDDAFGSAADKGFHGHVAALRNGRLSTGALKLVAIGALSGLAALQDTSVSTSGGLVRPVALWVLRTLAIALTANLVNLFDLRPGRALKVYSAIVVFGAIPLAAFGLGVQSVIWLVLLLGPAAAVWNFDLSERAMLGDAGANAAGALAGWFVASTFPGVWALAAYVAVVLGLNLVSERVSFSRVIEKNPILNWLDSLGRLPAEPAGEEESEKSSAK